MPGQHTCTGLGLRQDRPATASRGASDLRHDPRGAASAALCDGVRRLAVSGRSKASRASSRASGRTGRGCPRRTRPPSSRPGSTSARHSSATRERSSGTSIPRSTTSARRITRRWARERTAGRATRLQRAAADDADDGAEGRQHRRRRPENGTGPREAAHGVHPPARNITILGLHTDGGAIATTSHGPIPYSIGGLPPSSSFRLLSWNGEGSGGNTDWGFVGATRRGRPVLGPARRRLRPYQHADQLPPLVTTVSTNPTHAEELTGRSCCCAQASPR